MYLPLQGIHIPWIIQILSWGYHYSIDNIITYTSLCIYHYMYISFVFILYFDLICTEWLKKMLAALSKYLCFTTSWELYSWKLNLTWRMLICHKMKLFTAGLHIDFTRCMNQLLDSFGWKSIRDTQCAEFANKGLSFHALTRDHPDGTEWEFCGYL